MGIGAFRADKTMVNKPSDGMIALQFLLTSLGVVALFSASWYFAATVFNDPFRIWRRQLIWMTLGLLSAFAVYRMPSSWIRRSVPALVWIALALNLLTYIPGIGYASGGAQRWIELFGLTFQPSEITRVVLVLYLARMLEKNEGRMENFRDGLLPSLVIVALLVMTVYFQNDFSTAAYLLLLAMGMFFVAGISRAAIGVSIGAVALSAVTMLLSKPYRMERIRSWFRPEEDPAGAGYQLLKARTALERGGFWGRGLGLGGIKRGGLPAAHSDFVVAVVGEETGLLGILVILVLFTLFALVGWQMAENAPDTFSRWAVFGLVTSVYWQALVNFAVVCGLLPATGIPLPLFSAGGSAAFVTLIVFGLILKLAGGRE